MKKRTIERLNRSKNNDQIKWTFIDTWTSNREVQKNTHTIDTFTPEVNKF